MHLKIGTRGSPLALAQTDIFIAKLAKTHQFSYDIKIIKTSGDKNLSAPLYDLGGKALFLKELEEALLSKEIDFAVHSLKDVPGNLDANFTLPCFIGPRNASDVLISKKYTAIQEIPAKAKIGTCSPRRIVQIRKILPEVEIMALRGNVNSRIERLLEGEFDAIILAYAGIKRAGLFDPSFCHFLSEDIMIPAVGQGVIAAEALSSNFEIQEILKEIDDSSIRNSVMIEREFLSYLNADCKMPVAAFVPDFSLNRTSYFMIGNLEMNKCKVKTLSIRCYSQGLGEEIAKGLL